MSGRIYYDVSVGRCRDGSGQQNQELGDRRGSEIELRVERIQLFLINKIFDDYIIVDEMGWRECRLSKREVLYLPTYLPIYLLSRSLYSSDYQCQK